MQDKDNKEKKPRIRFDWFFTLFIIMAIIGVITLINYLSQPATDTLNYNELIYYVEKGKIEADKDGVQITATPIGGENYNMYNIDFIIYCW